GGYVLLAMLLAPYLRKFGKFTVPDFIGDRFYSRGARLVAVICLILISVTYVIGQMAGAGVAFSRFLEVSNSAGIWIAAAIVFAYAVFGGMKGITYTQVATCCWPCCWPPICANSASSPYRTSSVTGSTAV
ncbi:sodium:solute symporter family transporter, partial [Acinetobacter baumannii]|uniref:sodium:solute symporter family transporter n=1 Tax=Acinetobacter baumannii TaxID=470 RepID=UPI0039172893